MSKRGRIIRSRDLIQEFREKELSRRNFLRRASTASAGVGLLGAAACAPEGGTGDDDDSGPDEPTNYLVGMGGGDGYSTALNNALNETIGRDGLAFINSGDTVYLKVNSNSGNFYPYSTKPRLIELVGQWAFDQGASRVIVGDRSFWGDPGTYNNLVQNGAVEAAANIGAELIVWDEDDTEWVAFDQDEAPDWQGGFSYPREVVEADHIINLPIVKTHFISQFTMGMKNIIGIVNADDRRRAGNLQTHNTSGNLLYRQIAQLNQHITPSLTILDGWEAVVRGGPTINDGPGGLEDSPGVMIVSGDRIAADITGLAVLKEFAVSSEDIHDTDVWDNPQIVEAVEAGVGITGPDQYEVSGPTVDDLDRYTQHIV